MSTDSRNLATSLFKALDLLTLIGAQKHGMGIAEIVDSMGLPRSSLIRLLDSLAYYGFVYRDEQRRYCVTAKFREWRLGDIHDQLIKKYQPLMKRISAEVGEMVVLGRLEGRRIYHFHHEDPVCRVRVMPPEGRRFTLHSMAMGKLALGVRPDIMPEGASQELRAEVEVARNCGFAWNRRESEEGIIAWGTWLGEASPLTPMLAVTWPDFRYSDEALEQVKAILEEEAKKLGPFALFK